MERPFQAYEGDEPYVFVCYAHDDDVLVYPELSRLRETGLNIWYDEGISPTSEWSDVLARHIEGCTAFLYFVTPRSVVSEHCRREVNFALEQPCGMLAVHLTPTKLPSGLKLTLSNRQAILKYEEPAAAYEAKLSQAVRDAGRRDVQESVTSNLTLGDWTLDVGTQRLTCEEESHALDPKALSVLLHLIDRAPDVVSRQGLIDRTWPDVVVGDNVLDQAIAQLRRALGDDARHPKYIETLPRRGYRLVVPLETSTSAVEGMTDAVAGSHVAPRRSLQEKRRSFTRWGIAAALLLIAVAGLSYWLASRPANEVPALDRSIAVLPFSVVGADAGATTYAETLTEELRAVVTGYAELRTVAGPHPANPYDTHVASYVLGGNVQRLGEHLRLRAHLSRTDDRETVWANTWELDLADETLDPADMAATAGRVVRLQLIEDQQCESVRRTARSAEAAAAYCAAFAEVERFGQIGNIDPRLLLSHAKHALALDPGIPDVYRLVARGYATLAYFGQMDWQDAAREAHAVLDQGLALAPNDPRLLAQQGHVQRVLELDYRAAKASYDASLEGDPLRPGASDVHAALAKLALARGDLTEALEHYRRALRIYDAGASLYLDYAVALWFLGHNREAIRAADTGLPLVQSGQVRLYLLGIKASALHALGETAAANATIDDALASVGRDWRLGMANVLAELGRVEEAQQLVAELEKLEHPPVPLMALAYAESDHDLAFEWIHKAIDRHVYSVLVVLRTHPVYSGLRKDPRWNDVMAHLEAEEARGRAGDRG